MTTELKLTPDEVRSIMESRAQAALEAGPPPAPSSPTITEQEWQRLQLHRVARQSRIVGSGIVANTQDPMQASHSVAIVVLRSVREEAGDIVTEITLTEVYGILDRWLGILGADGKESRSATPGPG
ncbi:hypothetical protein BMS3Bbin02_00104 [bacterium BMS3Bbin02]|nr:hypothetical protein BMS3Bbin02_00104 [bacterium BMS3Bbin02]